ncbi:MAG: hypothetical protein ACKO9Q_32355, partial [Pirellula sp.]
MIRFKRIAAIVLFSWLAQTSSLLAEYQDKPQEPATNEPAPTETKVQDPKPVAETEKRREAIEKLLEQVSGELKARKDAESAKKTEELKKPDEKKPEAPADVVATPRPRTERQSPPRLPPSVKLEPSWLDEIKWRSIGPANMSGRITDIAVHEKDTSLWWIATASGGLLKSTNHGGSFQHQFDREKVVSIGSIATDPNNKDVLWVGTGEINPRNSVSYGNGVYKTVDGGKTFQHLGLD